VPDAATNPDSHYPLLPNWRLALLLFGALGLFAAGWGVGVLAGWVRGDATEVEAGIAALVGLAILPSVATALRHGALILRDDALEHLELGLFSSTGRIPLDEIAAVEVDRRIAARGKRRRVLTIETRPGERVEIPLGLFRGQSAFIDELARRTGIAIVRRDGPNGGPPNP